MDFLNVFKGLLGFPTSRETPNDKDYRSTFLNDDASGTTGQFPNGNEDQMGFKVFSNPVEMHLYFEQQMNNVLKSFGFPTDDSFFGFGHDGGSSFVPSLEEHQRDEPTNDNLRDYYLKPGYTQSSNDPQSRSDDDIDGKIDASDLDGVFNNEKSTVMPFRNTPRMQMFGQSVVSRTIRNPDGTIEIHRTVKDNSGNEETTVTRKHGNQEYTVITKIDKDGKKEVIENLLNLDDKDVQKFLGTGSKQGDKEPDCPITGSQHNWFPYEKYFK